MQFYSDFFLSLANCIRDVEKDISNLDEAVLMMERTRVRRGKVLIAGNGGSAAMASHVSVDLTKTSKLRAVNFNEADLITCFANDYGHENWISSALEFYADPNDLVILISSSGKSMNIVNAANKAKQMNLGLITFSGFSPDNPLRKMGDLNFWANSTIYNIIEMTHHAWLLAVVDKLANDINGNN